MFKVNNRGTRTRCEICSKLTIKTPEGRQWRHSGVFIFNCEHISHLILVFLLLTLSRQMPIGLRIILGFLFFSFSINFKQLTFKFDKPIRLYVSFAIFCWGVRGLQDASHSLNYIDYVDVILGKEDKLESFQCSADVAF